MPHLPAEPLRLTGLSGEIHCRTQSQTIKNKQNINSFIHIHSESQQCRTVLQVRAEVAPTQRPLRQRQIKRAAHNEKKNESTKAPAVGEATPCPLVSQSQPHPAISARRLQSFLEPMHPKGGAFLSDLPTCTVQRWRCTSDPRSNSHRYDVGVHGLRSSRKKSTSLRPPTVGGTHGAAPVRPTIAGKRGPTRHHGRGSSASTHV